MGPRRHVAQNALERLAGVLLPRQESDGFAYGFNPSPDGDHVYYAAQTDGAVELMRVDVAGRAERLTTSAVGVLNYQPKASDDGKWIVFGSNRTGTRQLYVMPTDGGDAWPITDVPAGTGAMWPLLTIPD